MAALLNGLAWSLLTPAFQVPDETAHFAYVQRLAESGVRAGDLGRPEFSTEQLEVMQALGTREIIGRPLRRAALNDEDSALADRAIDRAKMGAERSDGGGPSTASAQPPLYYALAALPYRVMSWASLVTRLQVMRGFSVLIFAVGAALCAAFVFELMPTSPGSALVGGLAVSLSPYTTFVASGVTPDTLLLTVCAALLLALARAARRGLTPRRATAIAILLGAGVTTKLTFIAFVPPSLIAIYLLFLRDREQLRSAGSRLRVLAALTAGGACIPGVLYLWLLITGRALRPAGTSTAGLSVTEIKGSDVREMVAYGWQLFLPRPPFMKDQFGFSPLKETWLNGFAGRYGWLDYSAPAWINAVIAWVALCVVVLVLVAAVTQRRTVRAMTVELLVAALFCVTLAIVIAKAGYDYRRTTGLVFEQPRYLFPVASFYALAVAAACVGAGRRAAPYISSTLVTLFCLHNFVGIGVTLTRYYG